MVTLVPSHKSIAVGGVKSQGARQSTTRLDAQVNVGGLVSTTVMVWLQVELFVHESVARHVRVAA